jgi:hypothetical protein
MLNYIFLFFFTIILTSSCANHLKADSNLTDLNRNSVDNVKVTSSNVSQNLTNEDSDETDEYNQGLKELILSEISGDWIDNEGTRYQLTKNSKQKMFEILLPVAEKQYKLMFEAQHLECTEEKNNKNVTKKVTYTSVNSVTRTETTTTTTTTVVPGSTTTTTVVPGKGKQLLQKALENQGMATRDTGEKFNNLNLVAINGKAVAVTKNSENTAGRILQKVVRKAIKEANALVEPLSEEQKAFQISVADYLKCR